MSDSLAGLRRKLGAAEQLGAVVRAMKAISASSIVQYENAVVALSQYQRSVELGLSLCLRDTQRVPTAASSPKDRPTGSLIFGSDQGLVGRFNEVITDFAIESLRTDSGPKTIWTIGERVCPPLEAAGLSIRKRFAVPSSVAAITALITQIQIEIEEYMTGEPHSGIQVFHNSPRALAHYEVASERLLPLDAAWHQRLRDIAWPGAQLAQVLGGSTLMLPALIREQLFISLYRTCAESLASENASRLEAMQRAEKNIESVADELKHSVNRLRQSSIDEELFDVVAGFNAIA